MVIDKKKHNDKPRLNQGSSADIAEPNKIASSTHFDFEGKNLTPYGGLFPVATMLEKLGFQKLGRPSCRIGLLEVDLVLTVDLLNGLAGADLEGGPQGGMTINQRLKRALQGWNVNLGPDARGEIHIVNHALWRELVQKPYSLLVIG